MLPSNNFRKHVTQQADILLYGEFQHLNLKLKIELLTFTIQQNKLISAALLNLM